MYWFAERETAYTPWIQKSSADQLLSAKPRVSRRISNAVKNTMPYEINAKMLIAFDNVVIAAGEPRPSVGDFAQQQAKRERHHQEGRGSETAQKKAA